MANVSPWQINTGGPLWKGAPDDYLSKNICLNGLIFFKGEHHIEKVSEIAQISDDIRLISWLEDSGYTITIIINTKTKTMFGISSTATEHSLLKGGLKNFSLGKR
ncbi:MAG: hypothetical protein MI863_14850 [Desulfobacterales bacterium]|nr:hypothetical protein [Desulfobacterales bacterium]